MRFDLKIIPDILYKIAESLETDKVYIVGGIVRDSIIPILSNNIKLISQPIGDDWDIASPIRPEDVIKKLQNNSFNVIPIGIEHGTVLIRQGELEFEHTTFRRDVLCDGRRAVVEFADNIEEDISRRDFTVNSMAVELNSGEVIDPFNGVSDLRDRIIRTVGEPLTRFREDRLRMLRAIRFACLLDAQIETSTWDSICRMANEITSISAERVREEIMKIWSIQNLILQKLSDGRKENE